MSRGAGSRETILAKVRSALPQSAPLPDVLTPGRWQTFENPAQRFQEVVASVGGQVVCVATISEAARHLESLAVWNTAAVRCSVVPGVGDSSFDLDAVTDPHVLENVDFAVLRGHLAVAENGAVWVRDDTLKHWWCPPLPWCTICMKLTVALKWADTALPGSSPAPRRLRISNSRS
jgi:L-lactate dehydrogenase complex protein LldG